MKVYIKDYYLSGEISSAARCELHSIKLKEGLTALGIENELLKTDNVQWDSPFPANKTESKGHPIFAVHPENCIKASTAWGFSQHNTSYASMDTSVTWTIDDVKYSFFSCRNNANNTYSFFAFLQDYSSKLTDYTSNPNLKMASNQFGYASDFIPDRQGKYRTIICHDVTTHMFVVGIMRVDDGKSMMMTHGGVKSFVSPSSTDIIFSPCANKVMPRTGISDVDSISFTVINQLGAYAGILDPQSKKDTLRNTFYNQKPLIGLNQFGLVAEANYWKSTIPTPMVGTIITINNEDYLTLRDGYYIKLGADGAYEKL